MDERRFDTLTLSLAGSRRRALGGVLAAALGLLRATEAEDAAAHDLTSKCKRKSGEQKKTCLKRARKHNASHSTLTCPAGQRPCRGACLSVLICCDESDCAGGRTCQQGTCACPAEKPQVCPGSTICQQCCTVADCRPDPYNDGQVCQNGQCACTKANTRRCPSGSPFPGICGYCCDNSECVSPETCWNFFGDTNPTCRSD
jgi:hypothetical protein